MDANIVALRNRGRWIETATNLDEAVTVAASLNPTIVLVGDSLSYLNSVELTIRIRSTVLTDAAPLFIMAPSCGEVCIGQGSVRAADEEEGMPGLICQLNELLEGQAETQGSRPRSGAVGLTTERIQCNGVCLDRVRHRAWVSDDELRLTPTEFKLLWELVLHPGFVRSRENLRRTCKGTTTSVQARTIDAHVRSIRRKLKDLAFLIETVHEVGYRFRDSGYIDQGQLEL